MIRRATILDATHLLQVRNDAIRELASSHYCPQDIEAWCAARTAESYWAAIEREAVLVYEQHDLILAFGQVDSVAAIIEALYVRPSYARRGLGVQVLRALEAVAAEQGTRELTLEASLNAVEFYRRAGYVATHEKEHGKGPERDATSVRMRHSLFV